jgi:hypothetical protein
MLVLYIDNGDRALCEKKVPILRRSEICAKRMKNFGGPPPGTSHCAREIPELCWLTVVPQVGSIKFRGSSENSQHLMKLSAVVEKHRLLQRRFAQAVGQIPEHMKNRRPLLIQRERTTADVKEDIRLDLQLGMLWV